MKITIHESNNYKFLKNALMNIVYSFGVHIGKHIESDRYEGKVADYIDYVDEGTATENDKKEALREIDTLMDELKEFRGFIEE